ncbi:PEP-CTERM putative exosortase interaction domain-containing protein [Rivularia sp. PCC 7116]|uniref:PEP-CTERM sorting domain-containing protein n=1 Tax=Rivularia sp. PCC 7116 TaxID=373994 RepID=UPI00029EC567|nr:PEP-CTERM sorting domain-containing protein [Rivularia sp. PCC 7116]AFY52962.1 PEP-CTERM putative exosortase interaction domain-containing protein [Rivularia sp. PCC 7116]
MNTKHKLIQKLILVAAPVLASSVLAISPSRAATFALSAAEFEFENFSQSPSGVLASTDTDTFSFEENGVAEATAEANAIFLQSTEGGTNFNFTEAFGENQEYLAFAESESELIGSFEIEADNSFSFDFVANLDLATSIDNPPSENARAAGEISFFLFDIDNNTVLDSFDLIGNLTTEGDNDFVALQASDNVNFNQESVNPNFGGLEESLEASVEGSYKRLFTRNTNLALVEFKQNRVLVQAPEPSASLALLVSSGVIGVIMKRRRK